MLDIQSIAVIVVPTGSRVICNPPVMDTDEDFVVLSNADYPQILQVMTDAGYTKDGGENYDSAKNLEDGGFVSFKKGTTNYIVVTSLESHIKWVRATNLAKLLNLREKSDRARGME